MNPFGKCPLFYRISNDRLKTLLEGAVGAGWGLSWLVVALAALNLFAGFCVGCSVYYWLMRLKVPGFTQIPPPGTLPGLRPRKEEQ